MKRLNYCVKVCLGLAALVVGLGLVTPPEASATWMKLCGYVYLDCNNNGVFDPGEQPIPGVTVTLSGVEADGAAPPYAGPRVTGDDGSYCFDVRPGTYQLTETQPAGIPDGKDTAGTCGGTASDDVIDVTLTKEQYDSGVRQCDNYNFGELCQAPPPASIGDTVWCDINANGIQEAGEPGIPGVEVTLTCADGTQLTATTGPDGKYLFANIPPGACTVEVNVGSVPAECSVPICDTSVTRDLAPGEIYLDADFCFTPPPGSSIGDTVYCDKNGNKSQDAGEPGIEGITVILVDAAGAIIGTQTTDVNGQYLFVNLPAGQYEVMVDTSKLPEDCSVPSCPLEVTVDLGPGEAYLDADFCFRPPSPGGCVGTPGYWCNQNGRPGWLEGIRIEYLDCDTGALRSVDYTQAEACGYMVSVQARGDKRIIAVRQLTAALLNLMVNGSDPTPLGDATSRVANWLGCVGYPFKTDKPAPSNKQWESISDDVKLLDSYNNGFEGPQHCP